MEHCCNKMNAYATEKNSLLDYDSYIRSFMFFVDSPNGTHEHMNYCPWCGTQLPEELTEKWINLLNKKFGIEEPFREWDRIPPEFKTDAWWKRRGL